MRRRRHILIGILFALGQLSAQEPRFEVASVRESIGGGSGWTMTPAGVNITGLPLFTTVIIAYGVEPTAALKKFDWGKVDKALAFHKRFDIVAKGEGDQRAMLRTLLVERFGLRTHVEMRPTPTLALKVTEGVLGPWLRPSSVNCRGVSTKPLPPQCIDGGRRNGAPIQRGAGTMADLIARFQLGVEQPLVDQTGLRGNYEWELAGGLGLGRASWVLRNALEEQLGLTLEARTMPYEVIVIDDVRMPTLN